MVLNHEVPDRLPIDFGATRGTGISAEAYLRLRKTLGINGDVPYMFDFVQQLVYPEEEVLRRFKVDVIDGGRAFLHSPDRCFAWRLNNGDEVLVPDYFRFRMLADGSAQLLDPTGTKVVGRKESTAGYFTQVYWVYQSLERIPEEIQPAELRQNIYAVPIHPWNLDLNDEVEFARFVDGIKKLYEETEYAIALTVHCQMFEMAQYIRGMEQFFVDMYLVEKGARRLLDRLLESYLVLLEKVCAGVGRYVETLRFVDDLGSQQAPLFDPAKYRSLIKPYHQEMWRYVHDHSSCKVMLHSCGAIYEFLPDLIDAGVDALNPVQTSCAGMNPKLLKSEFGDDIVFWGGGCDTQTVLPTATPEQVRQHVREQIEALAHGGGMVFSQIHNIQADVPASNIIAMIDTAYEYGTL